MIISDEILKGSYLMKFGKIIFPTPKNNLFRDFLAKFSKFDGRIHPETASLINSSAFLVIFDHLICLGRPTTSMTAYKTV